MTELHSFWDCVIDRRLYLCFGVGVTYFSAGVFSSMLLMSLLVLLALLVSVFALSSTSVCVLSSIYFSNGSMCAVCIGFAAGASVGLRRILRKASMASNCVSGTSLAALLRILTRLFVASTT